MFGLTKKRLLNTAGKRYNSGASPRYQTIAIALLSFSTTWIPATIVSVVNKL